MAISRKPGKRERGKVSTVRKYSSTKAKTLKASERAKLRQPGKKALAKRQKQASGKGGGKTVTRGGYGTMSVSTKAKVNKIKGKYKAPKKTQRGTVKARGGGPARPASKLQGQIGGAMEGFFNPFPEAAAFQNPFTLGWRVATKAGKTIMNTKTGRAHRTAHTEATQTGGDIQTFEGGMPGILGMPVGTGQKDITILKSGDKIVKTVGKKTYKRATGGDAAYSMEPNVFLKETGGEDFTKAGEWWSDYTKLTVAGKVEKGGGQPGYGKGGKGPSEAQKDQPGWYMKPKDGQGEFKVSGPAGGYRVMAGKGKTKTWAGGSTRIEAGAQPGGKWAYEKWFKFLTPGEQEGVKKSFKGSEGLYASTLDVQRGAKYGGKPSKTVAITSKSLTAALNSIPVGTLAKAIKKMPEAIQKDIGSYGYRNITDKNKQKLLGYAAEET